jgi:plastocyanin
MAAAAGALVIAVAGCGGGGGGGATTSSTTPTAGAGAKLALKAGPGAKLRFDKSSLQAAAGKVTITMANPSQLPHSVAIEGNGVDAEGKVVVGPGGTSTASATLKPGTYTYYCTVPGHRQAGMQGTLTVK